jgi:hypothetical protein
MRVTGRMIKLMEAVFIIIQMEPNMLESGLRINNMAKEAKPGLVNIHFYIIDGA